MTESIQTVSNPRLSSKSEDWGTPGWIAAASRLVLGRIDLDPASCAAANLVIQASHFFSKEDDGLQQPWQINDRPTTTIFLNPPGGKDEDSSSKVKKWWQKMLAERSRQYFAQGLFLAFSLDSLQVTQNKCEFSLLEFPTCFFRSRVNFYDTKTGVTVVGNTHASSITYVSGVVNNESNFRQVFSRFGDVTVCARRRTRIS